MRPIKKSVRFLLEKRKKWEGNRDLQRPVLLVFNYHAKRLYTGIGLKISENNWDYKKQRAKIGLRRASEINRYLELLDDKINDIYFTGLSEGIEITNAYLQQGLKGGQTSEPVKSFWDYYTDYLETQRRVIRHGTYKATLSSARRFKEFCKSESKLNIKFEDVNPGLLAHYTDFLLRRGNSNNTIHTHLRRLRRFMNHSKKLNLHKNETYKEYNVPERVGIIKFLELGEVKQLMTVQLDLPVEQKARDLLLFACFTGMRYSDIRALKKADIKQHQFEGVDTVFHAAHIRQLKTSRDIVVPLLPEALSLIREYENDPGEFTFPQLALQTVNNALKEVGKKAGLNSLQKIEVWRGSVKDTTYVEKWRVLSTHMGRRTFVTISATKGLPINVVASITGQNPKTTMLHYMGVVNVEKFRELTTKVKFQ
jgi:integrase